MVLVTLSSLTLSLTPVTVTVCAVFQFDEVKVNVDEERLISESSLSLSLNEKTTLPVGSLPSTTVKVSVLPLSETAVEPPVSAIVKAEVSPSLVLTVTL